MTDPKRDDDLADRVEALEDSLAELRTELRGPPRGPLGLPRPPTPRELLRFTERYAIPTAIAVLEANVRALRLLRGALRMTDPERAVGEGATETRDRAERAGRAALSRLDSTLSTLQSELDEGDLPRNGEARDIVEDARRLSAEIQERLGTEEAGDEAARTAGDDSVRPAGDRSGDDGQAGPDEVREDGERAGSGVADSDPDDAVRIDVEDELRSIKDELDGDGGPDDGSGPDDDGAAGDGGSADDDGTADDGGMADGSADHPDEG